MQLLSLPLLLAACSGEPVETPTPTPTPTPSPAPTTSCNGAADGVVSVTTRDDVTLAADYFPPPTCDAPGMVLLHMIPPSNDRTNWPRSFRVALRDAGFGVIAIDRRGAGDSGGDPVDAYTGPAGKYDVDAAVGKLLADGAGEIAIIGASNGTTSLLDYAVWAPSEGLAEPVALGFMTGGTYTEAQNPMSAVPRVPAIFTYSTAENAWSVAQQPLDPGTWVFEEYENGAHGTSMFAAAPEVEADLVGFFVDNVLAR